MRNRNPIFQKVAIWVGWILFGAISTGAILGAINSANNLLTPLVAICATCTAIIFWLVLEFYAKRYGIPWTSEDGQSVRLSGLGTRTRLAFAGSIVLLLVSMLLDGPNSNSLIGSSEIRDMQQQEISQLDMLQDKAVAGDAGTTTPSNNSVVNIGSGAIVNGIVATGDVSVDVDVTDLIQSKSAIEQYKGNLRARFKALRESLDELIHEFKTQTGRGMLATPGSREACIRTLKEFREFSQVVERCVIEALDRNDLIAAHEGLMEIREKALVLSEQQDELQVSFRSISRKFSLNKLSAIVHKFLSLYYRIVNLSLRKSEAELIDLLVDSEI